MLYSEKYRSLPVSTLPFMAILLTSSCSSVASTAESPPLSGNWEYTRSCGAVQFVGITLQQYTDRVTGDWSEGSGSRGGGGKLEGEVRGAKPYLRYCGDDGEAGYSACPTFSGSEDYFFLEKEVLIRYQEYGDPHERDIGLHPDGKRD